MLAVPTSFAVALKSGASAVPVLPAPRGPDANALRVEGLSEMRAAGDDAATQARVKRRRLVERTLDEERALFGRLSYAGSLGEREAAVREFRSTPLVVVPPPEVALERSARLKAAAEVAIDAAVASQRQPLVDARTAMLRERARSPNVQVASSARDELERVAERVDAFLAAYAPNFAETLERADLSSEPLMIEDVQRYFKAALRASVRCALAEQPDGEEELAYYLAVVRTNAVPQMDYDDNDPDKWFNQFLEEPRELDDRTLAVIARLRSFVRNLLYEPSGELRRDVAERTLPTREGFAISYRVAVQDVLALAARAANIVPGELDESELARKEAILSGVEAQLRLREARAAFALSDLAARARSRIAAIEREFEAAERALERPLAIERDAHDTRPLMLFARVATSDAARVPLVDAATLEYGFTWYRRRGGSDEQLGAVERTRDAGSRLVYAPPPSVAEPGAPAESLAGAYWVRVERRVDGVETAVLYSPVVRVRVFAECVRCVAEARFEVGPDAAARRFGECIYAEAPIDVERAAYMRQERFRRVAQLVGASGNGFEYEPRFDDALVDARDERVVDDRALLTLSNEGLERLFTLEGVLERLERALDETIVARALRLRVPYARRVPRAIDLPLRVLLNEQLALPLNASDRRFFDELRSRYDLFSFAHMTYDVAALGVVDEDERIARASALTMADIRTSEIWRDSPLAPRSFDETTMFVDVRGLEHYRRRRARACARSLYVECAKRRRRDDDTALDFVGRHSATDRQPTPYEGSRRGDARLRTPFDFDALHRRIERTVGADERERLRDVYNAMAQFGPRLLATNLFSPEKVADLLVNN